jgi:PAS domain S-box-containing protein
LKSFLSATGEMADAVRAHDWSATPLGPVEQWSETLLCSVNLILASRFPSVIFWGPEMTVIYNDDYAPFLADKHPDALGQSAPVCWKEAWHIIGPQFDAVMARGETTFREDALVPVMRNGHLQDVYWTYSYSPIFAKGAILGIMIVCRDVTEKKRADDIRQESEMKLRMATEAAELGIFIWHVAEDRVLWENERVYEIFRRTRLDGPLNMADFAVGSVHPNYAASYHFAVQQMVHQGTRFYFQGEFTRKDGSSGWIELMGQQLESTDNGLPIRIIGTVQDITERKKGEALLLTAEKLTAVGRLAASIAHEINNPLEAVTNLLYLARHSADLAEAEEYLATAEQELGRVSAITSQTLRFHRQSTSPTSIACEALTEGALALYRSRIVNLDIKVEERRRAGESVLCFEGEIRQVLNNLVGNAVDAMSAGGGRLLIRSRLGTSWSRRAGDYGRRGLIITIADTGSGMSPAVLKKIFEPFFTTKGIAGTGLGLWISQEIILRHRGTLSVRTSQREQGHGTVFTIFLPLDAVDRGVEDRGVEDRGVEDRGPEKAIGMHDRAAEIEALRKLASLSAEVSS